MKLTKRFLTHGRVIAIVIASYAIFMTPFMGKAYFPRFPGSFYQQLTQGFLYGQLNMSIDPSPKLASLDNPYSPIENHPYKILDLTYYHGKYFLYFGPLPVFTYFLPIKLLTGFHGAPVMAIFLYAVIAFIFNFLLLINIRNDHFPAISNWQLNLLGLMFGFANNSTFLIYRPRTYEIAIASTYAVMSIALYYLYKIFKNTFRARDYYIFSTCTAAAVAGRPHFTFVCIFLLGVVAIHALVNAPREKLIALVSAFLLPALVIGVALATYNYLRFDSIFEFGHTYQLGEIDYRHLKNIPDDFYRLIPLQLYYYFLQPALITKDLYVPELPTAWLSSLTNNTIYEPTIGLLATAPMVLMILFLARFILAYAKNKQQPARQLLWFQLTTVAYTAILLAILCMVYYSAERYVTDFLPYLLIASIINLWFVQTQYNCLGFPLMLLRAFIVFAIVAGVVVGIQFGELAFHPANGWLQLEALTCVTLFISIVFIALALACKLFGYIFQNIYSKLISVKS